MGTPHADLDTTDFGSSVSVMGTSIIIGNPGKEKRKGSVFAYRFDSLASSWNHVCEKYSYSVGILDNEDLLVVCGENYGSFTIVYHYENSGMRDEYVFKQGLRIENRVTSLAVDQQNMVVGERRVGRSNAIHFFVQEINVWEKVATIDESVFGPEFGRALALSGNITL